MLQDEIPRERVRVSVLEGAAVFGVDLQVLLVFVDVGQAEDVRMVDEFHNGDLSLHLHEHALAQFVSVDDLDGDLLAEDAVDTEFHQAGLPLAERLLEPVRPDVLVRLGGRGRAVLLLHLDSGGGVRA